MQYDAVLWASEVDREVRLCCSKSNKVTELEKEGMGLSGHHQILVIMKSVRMYTIVIAVLMRRRERKPGREHQVSEGPVAACPNPTNAAQRELRREIRPREASAIHLLLSNDLQHQE